MKFWKSFNENKGFKFGKDNEFNLAKGAVGGFCNYLLRYEHKNDNFFYLVKKGGKFKGLKFNALDKKFKGMNLINMSKVNFEILQKEAKKSFLMRRERKGVKRF